MCAVCTSFETGARFQKLCQPSDEPQNFAQNDKHLTREKTEPFSSTRHISKMFPYC